MAVTALAAPQRALADSNASADESAIKDLMREGFSALKKKDTQGAYKAFSSAWNKRQHFAIAISLAEVEMQLGRYVEAAGHWQFALAHLPDDLHDERDRANSQLIECKTHIGTITITAQPSGAAIYIDDLKKAEAPLDREVYLQPGDHSVYAQKAGKLSPTRYFHISEGSKLSFELVVGANPALPEPAAQPGPTAPSAALPNSGLASKSPRSSGSLRTPVVVGGILLTATAAVVGTVFALKSTAASDDARKAFDQAVKDSDPSIPPDAVCSLASRPTACDTGESKLNDKNQFRTLAIGSFIASGVLAAATITTFAVWPTGRESAAASGARVVPMVGRRFAGVVVEQLF